MQPPGEKKGSTRNASSRIASKKDVRSLQGPLHALLDEYTSFVESQTSKESDKPLPEELCASALTLWKTSAMARVFGKMRKKLPPGLVPTNAFYLADRAGTILQPGFVPEFVDILNARKPTEGVANATITVKGSIPCTLHFSDPAGQRNARRKWRHLFGETDVVLFVASLADYDEVVEARLLSPFYNTRTKCCDVLIGR